MTADANDRDPIDRALWLRAEAEQLRLYRGAVAYARADRNDPFALGRALAHIRVGICDTITEDSGATRDCAYTANCRP